MNLQLHVAKSDRMPHTQNLIEQINIYEMSEIKKNYHIVTHLHYVLGLTGKADITLPFNVNWKYPTGCMLLSFFVSLSSNSERTVKLPSASPF